MSRNVIVGLAVVVVAVLAWIVIARFDDGAEVADAPVDGPLTTEVEGDAVVVDVDPDAEPEANVEAVVDEAAPLTEAGEDAASSLEEANEVAEEEPQVPADAAPDAADSDAVVLENEVTVVGDEAAAEVDEAADEVEAAADAVGDAASDAAAATGAAIENAAEATADAVGDAADATAEAVDDAGEAVENDDPEVVTTTVPITPAEGTVDADAEIAELLTPETFDADRLIVLIDESDLDADARTSLRTAVEEARDDPSLVDATIERIRTDLEIE
ncbi:hypothetical protein [Jannaschia sp. W003]|uniref:hypothetical protein n=1 Tax=Jannaschia sp. W003 TaxID=2867012 RepID=UPI0021A422EA|nr:hypothetical protein [Jannaschia sp. W003]UWQ20788.1 hypothetical protein K3554_12505 [Jannaschia sp. W003]